MSNFSQQATQVARRTREGFVGQWAVDSHLKRFGSGINKNPQKVNIWTATVNADPGDDQDITFRFTFDDYVRDITINTGTGLNTTTIADLIVEEINQDSLLRGQFIASNVTTALTFTGLNTGRAFTPSMVANPSTAITAITESQAEDTADDIEVGRAVCITGQNTSDAGTEPEHLVALAATGLFTAQVQTISVTYVASAVLRANVYEVRGQEKILLGSAIFTSATDRDTTIDGLISAINTALPANTVDVAADNATATALVFTAEIAGLEFFAEIEHQSGGASVPVIASTNTTGPSPATSLHRAWGGVSMFSLADEAALIGGTVARYPANHGVLFARGGQVYVFNDEATRPSLGEVVYVDLGGTYTGKFFRSSSSTRVALSRDLARWERASRTTDNLNLAVLRLGPAY